MRGIVKRETNQRSHNTDSPKADINRVMSNINKDHVMRVCQRYWSRTEAIIGGYIE